MYKKDVYCLHEHQVILFFPLIIERKNAEKHQLLHLAPTSVTSRHRLSGGVRCNRPLCEGITQP